MDLLGSILNSMDKPPTPDEKQKQMMKRQREEIEKQRSKQKEELNNFRKYVTGRIQRFAGDERRYVEFEPLDKIYRTIIHDVAEVAGLIAMSFGQEGIDRYTVVYKKEHAPMEEEIRARRCGKEWNDKIAEEYAAKNHVQQHQREREREREREDTGCKRKKNDQNREKIEPNPSEDNQDSHRTTVPTNCTNYRDKYAHIIGRYSDPNAVSEVIDKTYGCVPSRNKKDVRSIEQAMNDIRAQKRLKLGSATQTH